MGHSELAVRHFEKASHYYALARQMETGDRLARHQAVLCLAYAMCMDGKVAEAQLELIQSMSDARNLHPLVREDLNFLSREFGLSVPTSVAAAAPRPTATVVAR
jgi:nicotinate-nucleotide pyrophosphorylase